MVRITLFMAALLLCAAPVFAQDQPTPTPSAPKERMSGLLWEITGHGAKKPSFLYGTMHVPEKMVFNLSDSFFLALRSVDVVALETDHELWQEFTETMRDEYGNGLSSLSNGGSGRYRRRISNLYDNGFDFYTPNNRLLGVLLSFKPVMSNEFLYRSNTFRQEYEEDTYLDLFIFQAGKKLGKRVIGLETMEGSYEMVTRARIPDDEPRKGGYKYVDGNQFQEAYRQQDLHKLDSLHKLTSPGKTYQKWMLDERNLIHARGMDSVIQAGGSIFAGVGAAHLPGEEGVIWCLRKMGYTVRPVTFTNKEGNSDKEAIDKLRFPVQFSTQWALDSTWSVDAPGKFYRTVDADNLDQYLCADMSNGTFYSVTRLKTFGGWTGQSPAYIAGRLDSMLYEKIPGKIFERKALTEPFPGHEIATRTRRGDVQRYKIYVTPIEIILFTIGGNGEYANGEEADRFLNSIRFSEKATKISEKSTVLQPTHGGMQVTFPASLQVNTTNDVRADVYYAAATTPSDSAYYFVYRADYPDWEYIEEDTFELNIIGEKIAKTFTKKAPEVRFGPLSPYPTQEIRFKNDRDSMWHFAKIVVDGQHYFVAGVRKKTKEWPEAFFNSFRIMPKTYPAGWEMERDTNLFFHVKWAVSGEKKPNPFFIKLTKINEEAYRKRQKRSGGYDYEPREGNRVLRNARTGEEINIRSWVITSGRSQVPSIDSLQRTIREVATNNKKLSIREEKWENRQDTLLIGSLLLADTNSNRGIRSKFFIKDKRSWSLETTVNLDTPESAFVKAVFETFTPADTNATKPFQLGKNDLVFLRDIYAVDSVSREKALKTLDRTWSFNLKPEDFQPVKAALTHERFDSLKMSSKTDLLTLAAACKSKESVRFLSDFFHAHADSVRYQVAVIKALSHVETTEARAATLDLLTEKEIYTTGDYDDNILDDFSDSLELSATFYSRLLKLAENERYRSEILDLTREMQERGLLKPKAWAKLKPYLLSSVRYQLSEHRYTQEIKREKKDSGGGYYRSRYEEDSDDSEGTFERNLRLLAPFIEKDKAVKAAMEDIRRYGDEDLQLVIYEIYLQEKIPVAPQQLRPFAENEKTRSDLYEALMKLGLADQYRDWFSDTLSIVRSWLLGDMDEKLDSVQFVSVHKSVRFAQSAKLYFFDIKLKDNKEWGIAYVTVPDSYWKKTEKSAAHKEIFDPETYEMRAANYRSKPTKSIVPEISEQDREELLQNEIGKIRFANRKRYDLED